MHRGLCQHLHESVASEDTLTAALGGFKPPHVKIIIKAPGVCGAGGWLRRLLARCLSLPVCKSVCPDLVAAAPALLSIGVSPSSAS